MRIHLGLLKRALRTVHAHLHARLLQHGAGTGGQVQAGGLLAGHRMHLRNQFGGFGAHRLGHLVAATANARTQPGGNFLRAELTHPLHGLLEHAIEQAAAASVSHRQDWLPVRDPLTHQHHGNAVRNHNRQGHALTANRRIGDRGVLQHRAGTLNCTLLRCTGRVGFHFVVFRVGNLHAVHLVQVEERLGTQRLLQSGTVVEGTHQGGIHTAAKLIVHVQAQVARRAGGETHPHTPGAQGAGIGRGKQRSFGGIAHLLFLHQMSAGITAGIAKGSREQHNVRVSQLPYSFIRLSAVQRLGVHSRADYFRKSGTSRVSRRAGASSTTGGRSTSKPAAPVEAGAAAGAL